MSKIAVGVALLLGFLFACAVVGFAILGGSQSDVGYGAFDDVGTDSIDSYDDYDVENTFMELSLPLMRIYSSLNPFWS